MELPCTANQNIALPVVRTNQGGHYDQASGVFTCPHTGLYIVGLSVRKSNEDNLAIMARTGGGCEVRVADFELNNRFNTVTATGACVCNEGETITMKAIIDCTIQSSSYTSFTVSAI